MIKATVQNSRTGNLCQQHFFPLKDYHQHLEEDNLRTITQKSTSHRYGPP